MTHRFGWDDLRFLLAVADSGSVNGAAAELGVNHATVIRRIAAFEAKVGAAVFEKSARGYRLNPTGVAVIDAARDVDRAVDRVSRTIAGQETPLTGSVTITSTDSLSSTVLPALIANFRRKHPDIRTTIVSTNAHLNLSKLDADVTIRPAEQLSPELVGRKACEMQFHVYGSHGYLAAHSSNLVDDHLWLGVAEALSRSPVGAWMRRAPDDAVVLKCDSFPALAAHAEAGLGLAMLPRCIGDKAAGLSRAPHFGPPLKTGIWVAAHADLAPIPRIAACLDFFTEALNGDDTI